ncbi:MAG: hypothetical protein FWE34_05280 [Defluviitaleaceae bacterium]|nr:hypothetical protein [Defluviitaleaceae bacterium]
MQKRWLPFIAALIVIAFISGQFFGANAQVEHSEAREETQTIMQTTIAVINADTGSIVDGERQNFSAAIIETLGEDFVLVSPAMAYTGLSTGMYGAVITFPSHVSERVLSFNTQNPEQVRLEFQINPNLPEQDFIETHTRIMDLQMAINTTIAYTYVSSIFYQFHAAQDEIGNIFQNDLAHLEALGIVDMEQFTASLQLDALPALPLDPNAPVTSHFLLSVTDFAEIVADMYQTSFDTAVYDYLNMRYDLIAMTEHFPEQEREWLEALEIWADVFDQYGSDLEEYSFLVRMHQMDLEDWYMQASFWNEDLTWYHENLDEWFDDIYDWSNYLHDHEQESFDWFMFATGWQDELIFFQSDLEMWHSSAVFWNDQLSDFDALAADWATEATLWHEESVEHMDDVSDWHNDLLAWSIDAEDWHDISQDYLDDIEAFGDDAYYYLSSILYNFDNAVYDLQNWLYDLQTNNIYEITNFIYDYNNYVYDLDLMFVGLDDWYNDLHNYYNALNTNIVLLEGSLLALIPPLPNIAHLSDPLDQMTYLLDWHGQATTSILDLPNLVTGIGGIIPAFDYATAPVISYINLPTLNQQITQPPTLNTYLTGQNFVMPNIVLPHPQGIPPAFYGIPQPIAIHAPPELFTDQPEEPPTLDTEQPNDPPSITALPPLTAMQPILTHPGNPMLLETYQPFNPIVGRPPRANDFWDSLDDMHWQLMRFDVDNYLTSAYRWEINRMLWDYERYLDDVRFDLASQFDENVDMLLDVRFGYTDFLSDLRAAALQAEADTIEQLDNTLSIFAQRVEDTSEDTRDRLETFANMMPESRTPLGPNRDLTRFTVAPFDVVTPQMRGAAMVVEVEAETIVPVFESYLWIALPILVVIFVLTLGSYGVELVRKAKGRSEDE